MQYDIRKTMQYLPHILLCIDYQEVIAQLIYSLLLSDLLY